jgi:hypothetical protein
MSTGTTADVSIELLEKMAGSLPPQPKIDPLVFGGTIDDFRRFCEVQGVKIFEAEHAMNFQGIDIYVSDQVPRGEVWPLPKSMLDSWRYRRVFFDVEPCQRRVETS